jgi:hypothetical protein
VKKHHLIFATLFALALASSIAHAQALPPDMPMLQKLESGIKPSDYPKWGYVGKAPDVTKYARYYAGYSSGGHRLIAGEFVMPESAGDKPAGIYVVANEKKFPMIADGACSVVHVVYDVDMGRMLSLTCNGRA